MYAEKGIGFSIGNSLTAGESYEEYSFAEEDPIKVVRHVYSYESQPEDDWPVLIYNVTVQRSWQPYARGYIVIQVMLNCIGFSAFWLPPSCGERMSLSVTAMLAALASEIVVAANLPAAAEMTWFSRFSMMSMFFAFISLLECVVVLYFYYKRKREIDIRPRWWNRFRKSSQDAARHLHGTPDEGDNELEASAKQSMKRKSLEVADDDSWADNNAGGKENSLQFDQAKEDLMNDDSFRSAAEEIREETIKSESISRRRSIKMQAYEAQRQQRESQILKVVHEAISRPPQTVPRDADDFHDAAEVENNLKWKQVASRIDDIARLWIPAAFAVALGVILAEAF